MLTLLPTIDKIANVIDNNIIIGSIYYQDKDQSIVNVKKNQCKYCLRDYAKTDHLINHQRICRVMQAQQREDRRSYFAELQVP